MSKVGLMTDPGAAAESMASLGKTEEAGRLLREAREAKGLDLASLSAAVKVQVKRLEALEAGRIDELPDLTFARALAKTICRFVDIDPAPVLVNLPIASMDPVRQMPAGGLNEPFRPTGSLKFLGADWGGFTRPAMVAPALLVLGALAVYFWPAQTPSTVASQAKASESALAAGEGAASVGMGAGADPVVAGGGVSVPASSASSVFASNGVLNAPLLPASSAASAANSPALIASQGIPPLVQGPLILRASAQAWVEVRDAQGHVLLSRLLMPGETTGVDGALPMRIKIGNVEATQVVFKGQIQDLSAWRKANVARLVLE